MLGSDSSRCARPSPRCSPGRAESGRRSPRGGMASGSLTCGAAGRTRPAPGPGWRTAWSSPTRCPSRSRPSARCCWPAVARSTWTHRCRATGRSSAPPPMCARCCRIRRAWWRWTSRYPPRRSTTGTGCARCWRRRSRPGSPGPRTASRRCSTATWPGNWSAVSTGAGLGGFSATRSAARWAWISLSGSPRPSRPVPSTWPASRSMPGGVWHNARVTSPDGSDPAASRRSRIVFGTFALPDTAVAPALLDRFHAAGGRALDLANVYRDGEAAVAAGKWLAQRRPAGVVVYAKGCHPPACRPDLVRSEAEKALRLTGLDYLDVFLLHRDDPGVPAQVWAEALQAEVAAGRIGAFGVSNWTLTRTRELAGAVARTGRGGLAAFSNHFSLAEMVSAPWPDCLAVTRAELPELAALGLRVLTWSSLATGYFAGRDQPSWSSPANAVRRERARELAARRGVSPTAIALAYVLHQDDHVMPVIGTVSADHLGEALDAAALELTADEAGWLERGA